MQVYTSTNGMYRMITLSRLRQPLKVRDADRKVNAQPVADVSLLCLYDISYYVIKTQDSGKPSLSSGIVYPVLWKVALGLARLSVVISPDTNHY